jgi:endonuclease/exonuclease/phosphatase (EEP) superfamily protein YafD
VLPLLAGAGVHAPTPGATHPSDAPTRQIDFIGARGLDLREPRVSPMVIADHRTVTAQVSSGP